MSIDRRVETDVALTNGTHEKNAKEIVALEDLEALEDPTIGASTCVLGAVRSAEGPVSRGATSNRPTTTAPSTHAGMIFELVARQIAYNEHYSDPPVIDESTQLAYAFQFDPVTRQLGINPELVTAEIGEPGPDQRAWTLAVAGSAAHEMGHYYLSRPAGTPSDGHASALSQLIRQTWPALMQDVTSHIHRKELFADAFAGCQLSRGWTETRPVVDFFRRYEASDDHPGPDLRVRAIEAGVRCDRHATLATPRRNALLEALTGAP
jgi:hypothetical protein